MYEATIQSHFEGKRSIHLTWKPKLWVCFTINEL